MKWLTLLEAVRAISTCRSGAGTAGVLLLSRAGSEQPLVSRCASTASCAVAGHSWVKCDGPIGQKSQVSTSAAPPLTRRQWRRAGLGVLQPKLVSLMHSWRLPSSHSISATPEQGRLFNLTFVETLGGGHLYDLLCCTAARSLLITSAGS